MAGSEPFIWQIGKQVGIVSQSTDPNAQRTIRIICESPQRAHRLALSLSGLSRSSDSRFEKFLKLQSHPWYGTILLETLSDSDREFIVLYIDKSVGLTDEEYRRKVHLLFLDESKQFENCAVIQEVLSLCR